VISDDRTTENAPSSLSALLERHSSAFRSCNIHAGYFQNLCP
jgi:hypothetical protein